jgi:hypothetical protein
VHSNGNNSFLARREHIINEGTARVKMMPEGKNELFFGRGNLRLDDGRWTMDDQGSSK